MQCSLDSECAEGTGLRITRRDGSFKNLYFWSTGSSIQFFE